MSKLRRRIERNTFRNSIYMKKLEINPDDSDAADMLEYYASFDQQKLALEESEEWRKDNLEYDLRTSDVIADKCADEVYAQNLYAALCNNQFVQNDLWPLLKDKRWSCSWRYAGGIVADIRESGDYMDWYCSGIRNTDDYLKESDGRRYVAESIVTDEIKQDLFSIGWLVVEDAYEDGDA